MTSSRIAMIASRVRFEEKSLAQEFQARKVNYEVVDPRNAILGFYGDRPEFSCILNRSISQSEGFDTVSHFEMHGCRCVNSAEVISNAGNKAVMTRCFVRLGLPVPKAAVCYSPDSALKAAESIGYPLVVKPIVGSWGRMIARLDNEETARAIFEYKAALPSLHQKVFFLQEYIEKPGRDIRCIVIGSDAIATYFRYSDHWITNIKRGGIGVADSGSKEIAELSRLAANAVGGGVVSVDLIERSNGDLLVNEVNHTMEFQEAASVTEVDIAGHYVDYCLEAAA